MTLNFKQACRELYRGLYFDRRISLSDELIREIKKGNIHNSKFKLTEINGIKQIELEK